MKNFILQSILRHIPIKVFLAIAIVLAMFTYYSSNLFSQCQPYIAIDGNQVLANQTIASGLALPYWLTENQTLAVGQMVNAISVIEFNLSGTTLEFSRVLSIDVTTPQVVPSGKVWKIESISKQPALYEENGAAFSNTGTYNFLVPACASYICVEIWGAGGGAGGGSGNSSGYGGGGGGGGGYGRGCFQVSPGSTLNVSVGAGGAGGDYNQSGTAGGTSGISGLISVTGGNGGSAGTLSAGAGGAGGTTTGASVSISGGIGSSSGIGNKYYGGMGGNSGSGTNLNGGVGGAGGFTSSVGSPGSIPGGGGGGGAQDRAGGNGAAGRVLIKW